MTLTLSIAHDIINSSIAKASELGALVSVAVVDAGGNLVAFSRMDGAEIAGPTLAVDKAYTSVSNKITTEELATLAVPGGPLFGIHANGHGRFVIFGGGVPIFVDGIPIAGIGVSGGAVEEDIACANAGLAVATRLIPGAN